MTHPPLMVAQIERKAAMVETIVSIVVAWLLAALVIYVVSRLNLGMTVDGFMSALVAAAVIAIVTWVVVWILGLLGVVVGDSLFGLLIALVVAAFVLMLGDSFVSGMKVRGFIGAVVSAIAIAIVTWLAYWVIGLLQL
jgi:putative membrane protein